MDELALLDWKRRVFQLYAEIRADGDPEHAWRHWRDVRAELFATHPQTPSPDARPAYYDYDATLRTLARVEAAERVGREIATSGERPYSFTRFGRARFELHGEEQALDLYW